MSFDFGYAKTSFFTWRLTQETYSMLKTAIRKCFVRQQKLTIVSLLLCLLNSHYRCANLLTRLYSSIMILLGYLKYSCIVTLSNFIYVNVYIHINNYRYSRQINIHEEENEHYTTQCFTEKDIHLTENNNIEGQENFNMSSNPSFMKENASPGNENKDDASNNESVSVKDDFGNITPWTEKL